MVVVELFVRPTRRFLVASGIVEREASVFSGKIPTTMRIQTQFVHIFCRPAQFRLRSVADPQYYQSGNPNFLLAVSNGGKVPEFSGIKVPLS